MLVSTFFFLVFAFLASGGGLLLYPKVLQYFTMILQRPMIIVGDAGFEPGTAAPEVWCATNAPPHLHRSLLIITFPNPKREREPFLTCDLLYNSGSSAHCGPARHPNGSSSGPLSPLITATPPAAMAMATPPSQPPSSGKSVAVTSSRVSLAVRAYESLNRDELRYVYPFQNHRLPGTKGKQDMHLKPSTVRVSGCLSAWRIRNVRIRIWYRIQIKTLPSVYQVCIAHNFFSYLIFPLIILFYDILYRYLSICLYLLF